MFGARSLPLHLANLKLSTTARFNNSLIISSMDNLFLLNKGDRSAFLQHMIQFFGCTYICLWSYFPQPTSCLLYLDGIFRAVTGQQPSSSAGSFARRHFNIYCESVNFVDDGRIPGFAFKNNLPYMELKSHDFRRMASTEPQLQFYQEAGIQTVVFMGCATGEIELGMSTDPQVDLEIEMKNWFPVDFLRQEHLMPHQPSDQNQPPSSSSSSLQSLSVESPEYSPLLFHIPTKSTSFIPEPAKDSLLRESMLEETLDSSIPVTIITSTNPQQQVIHPLGQIRNVQFPTIEIEEAAMTKAILAVLSSPATTSSSVSHQNLPAISYSKKPTAFRSFQAALAPIPSVGSRKQNMFRRAVEFFRNLNLRRTHELQVHGNRPTTTQLHHMISERRRREKLNESFQILRSLLPPGSKKDKASVLSATTENLSSLKSQVKELKKRNETLELELFMTRRKESEGGGGGQSSSSLITHDHQTRVSVNIENNVSASSTSNDGRFLDLRVGVSGECNALDLVILILEFLKGQRNANLLSMESTTRMIDTSTQVHALLFRLKVEGDEFDEAGFREAIRRVVDDLDH